MIALIRAELLKLRTIRSTWWIAAAGAFCAALVVFVGLFSDSSSDDDALQGLVGISFIPMSITMLLIGMLVATSDHRHNTATATFLITPRRGRVLAAKAITVVGCGLIATVVGGIITAAIGLPILATVGLTLVDPVKAVAVGLGLSAAFVLFSGLFAFAAATLIRDQVGAVFAVFGLSIGSLVLLGYVPAAGQWLPYPAVTSLVVGVGDPSLLPAWAGGLVLLGWAVVLGLGAFQRARGDLV